MALAKRLALDVGLDIPYSLSSTVVYFARSTILHNRLCGSLSFCCLGQSNCFEIDATRDGNQLAEDLLNERQGRELVSVFTRSDPCQS